jgi:hypothetical protein
MRLAQANKFFQFFAPAKDSRLKLETFIAIEEETDMTA